MLDRRGYNPQLSFGVFFEGRLISFVLNGTGMYNNILTAYDTGTGTVPSFRGLHLTQKIFTFSLELICQQGVRQYVLEVLHRGFDGGDFKGTQKAVINIENRTRFNDVLGGVVFFDIGRAWNYKGIDQGYIGNNAGKPNYDEKFPDDFAMSAGVGLRINTPMGPLRFDFGWPIGSDRRSGMEFYFNMGQSF